MQSRDFNNNKKKLFPSQIQSIEILPYFCQTIMLFTLKP